MDPFLLQRFRSTERKTRKSGQYILILLIEAGLEAKAEAGATAGFFFL